MLILGQAVEPRSRNQKPKNRRERRAGEGKGKRIGLDPKETLGRKQFLRGCDEDGNRHPAATRHGDRNTFAASEPWIDAAFPTIRDVGPDGEPIYYHFEDPKAVPPGFVRCPRCGHQNPPQCIGSSGHCDDCRYGAMSPEMIAGLPGSTSSVSISRIRASRARAESATPGGM